MGFFQTVQFRLERVSRRLLVVGELNLFAANLAETVGVPIGEFRRDFDPSPPLSPEGFADGGEFFRHEPVEQDGVLEPPAIVALEQVAHGHLSIGRGCATLYFERGWLSGCHEERIKAEAIAAGLPVIDSRAVPFDRVWDLAVRGPMVAVGEPPSRPPYHAFAYAPLAVVLEAYRAAGAEVFNVPAVPAPGEGEG